jgi:23S rRNA (pseudouridine1915-N3)-methyltransferase
MKIAIAAIVARKTKSAATSPEAMFADYVQRIARYAPVEAHRFLTEAALFGWLDQQSARTAPHLILLDSRGKQLSSEDIAAHIGRLRDSGVQHLVFAIGPADGWSPAARARAGTLLSLGPITLPHELARVVLAEQVYRALTILAGHPYHSGH